MSKNSKKYFIIISIIIVLYNILVWVIPFPKKDIATFVLMYVASMIALIAQPVVYYIAMNNKETLKSKLYGLPILRIGYIYGVAQLIITILFYIIGAFAKVPVWISIILTTFVIGLAAIGLLITETYRDEIEKMENSAPLTKRFILNLRIESEAFARKIVAEPLHSEIVRFTELVKYSDPISSETLIDFEDEIERKFIEIKELAINDKIEEASKELKELHILMEERNKRCKLFKK